jgi:hypothetical protein
MAEASAPDKHIRDVEIVQIGPSHHHHNLLDVPGVPSHYEIVKYLGGGGFGQVW